MTSDHEELMHLAREHNDSNTADHAGIAKDAKDVHEDMIKRSDAAVKSALSDHEDLIRRSEETDARLEALLLPLFKADEAHRRVINILIGVVTVLALLTLALGYGGFRIQRNSQGLAKVEALCEASNTNKEAQRSIWDFVLNIPPSTPQSEEQIANRERFKLLLDETFAPSDCSLP